MVFAYVNTVPVADDDDTVGDRRMYSLALDGKIDAYYGNLMRCSSIIFRIKY